jgi:hypothetical protein
MRKMLWSISTTVRNPERLIDFLSALKDLEGRPFDKGGQERFQILLIAKRLYKPTKIPAELRELVDNPKELSLKTAEKLFHRQNYQDPPMRGRQSANPLNKLGFAIAKESMGPIQITDLGRLYLSEGSDIGHVFFKSLLKFQLPNPLSDDFREEIGFDIQPLVAALHLISKTGSLSQREFSIFVPSLINYRQIEERSRMIGRFRKMSPAEKSKFEQEFLKDFYGQRTLTQQQKTNPYEYGDNTMRYFRLTKYFRVTTHALGGWRIDCEPARSKEIEQLLKAFNGAATRFKNVSEYIDYIGDMKRPGLPWETDQKKARAVAAALLDRIDEEFRNLDDVLQGELSNKRAELRKADVVKFSDDSLASHITALREFRLRIIQLCQGATIRNNWEELKRIVALLKDGRAVRELDPVEFEDIITRCFKIIDDEIRIKPNYVVDDEGKPIAFAPGSKADIEAYYEAFNTTLEATLDSSRSQVYRESMPVMRHLDDFQKKNPEKPAFCVFIAPRIHNDTVNYFWVSVRHDFQGTKQKIIALDIDSFVKMLEWIIRAIQKGKSMNHKTLLRLFKRIVDSAEVAKDSISWQGSVGTTIDSWGEAI